MKISGLGLVPFHDMLTSMLQHWCLGSVQVQMASGERPKYSGSFDCARQLYREGGIRNVYKGTAATFWRGELVGL